MQRTAVVFWVAALCWVAFWNSTGLSRYYDDWSFVAAAALALEQGDVAPYLMAPVGLHWSPLWNLTDLVNFVLVGWDDDRVIRFITLAAHATGLLWFAHVGRTLGVSRPGVMVGLAVLALHHVRAAALYSFDTYSQVVVDLGTWVASGLALIAVRNGRGLHDWRMSLAALLPLLLLPMKEQALSGCVAVVGIMAIAWMKLASAAERRRGLIPVAAIVVGVAAFTAARYEAGVPLSGEEVYRLCLTCVPRNTALITGSLLIPLRTLDIVDAWSAGRTAYVAVAAVATALLVALILPAVRHRDGLSIVLLILAAMVPTTLLSHVGELYAHTATFWYAMLVSLAIDRWRAPGTPVLKRVAVSVAMTVYVLGIASGLRANLGEMRATGELAALWRERYDATVASLPAGSVVFIRSPWPVRNPGDYSLYRLTSPDFVMTMWTWVRRTEADKRIEVIFEWSGDTDLDALRTRARTTPVYQLSRTADTFVIMPLVESAPTNPPVVSGPAAGTPGPTAR